MRRPGAPIGGSACYVSGTTPPAVQGVARNGGEGRPRDAGAHRERCSSTIPPTRRRTGVRRVVPAHDFTQFRLATLRSSAAGRVRAALRRETSLDGMVYFEDDMFLHTEDGVCVNGFRTVGAEPARTVCAEIVQHEDLDFLKVLVHEFFGDHIAHWGYYNLRGRARGKSSRTTGHARGCDQSYRGLSYMLGDVFYSNWPMLITRRGIARCFSRTTPSRASSRSS